MLNLSPLVGFMYFLSCYYFKLSCNKLRKSSGSQWTHSGCAPVRKSTLMRDPAEKTWGSESTSFTWAALPNICPLIHCALERTQTTAGWRPSFSRRSQFSLAGINRAPAAAAVLQKGGKASPGLRRGSWCEGENRASTCWSLSMQDRKCLRRPL